MGAQENEQSVRRVWDGFWSKGNLDAAADFYAPTYREVPATGKETEITGNDIFEFDADGKVVDHWHEADHLLLYQQVGGEIRPK